jgi:hypothetical protein
MGRPSKAARGQQTDDLNNTGEPPETDDFITDDSPADELEGLSLDATFEDKIRSFFDLHNLEKLPITVTLYKYDNPVSGNEKVIEGHYKNDIPDFHTIGINHGGGRYQLIVITPKGKKQARLTRTMSFRLGDSYNQAKMDNDLQKNIARSGNQSGVTFHAGQYDPQQGINASFEMIAKMLGLLMPLINRPAAPQNELTGAMQAYSMMQAVLKDNLEDTAEFYRKLKSKNLLGASDEVKLMDKIRAELEEQAEEKEESPQNDLLATWLPVIQQFIPLFIKNDVVSRGMQAATTAIPAVRQTLAQVQQNPEELKKLIDHFEKDKRIGKQGMDIALKNLGIARPS